MNFRALWIAIPIGLFGCTEVDPLYCTSDTMCGPGNICYLPNNVCMSGSGADSSMSGQSDLPIDVKDLSMPPRPDLAGCTSSEQCTDSSKPICINLVCQPCGHSDASVGVGGMDSECAAINSGKTPLCSMSGACVQCLVNADCQASQMTCDPNLNQCAPCKVDSDCTTRYCNAGSCANPIQYVYVDINTCKDPGNGTLADPFCSLQKGLDTGASMSLPVLVFGGAKPYTENPSVKTPAAAYTVKAIGVGNPVVTTAAINTPIFYLLADGTHPVNVSFDGFTFQNSSNAPGVRCANTGAVTQAVLGVSRSTVTTNGGLGVDSNGCTLNLDRDVIGPSNVGGGISMNGSTFAITNTLVRGNGSPGSSAVGGISIATLGAGQSQLFNATIVDNHSGMSAGASGLACFMPPAAIANVVLFGNSGAALETSCTVDHGAFVGDLVMSGVNLAPCAETDLFVAPGNGDFHENPNAPQGCVLKAAGTKSSNGIAAPPVDLDGKTRAPNVDIGAYQL